MGVWGSRADEGGAGAHFWIGVDLLEQVELIHHEYDARGGRARRQALEGGAVCRVEATVSRAEDVDGSIGVRELFIGLFIELGGLVQAGRIDEHEAAAELREGQADFNL